VVSWSAALDFTEVIAERPSAVKAIEQYVGIRIARHEVLTPQDQANQLIAQANPVDKIKPGAPAMFIANSLHEFMPLDQAEEFANKMKADGNPVVPFSAKAGHALTYTRFALQPSVDFLDKYLKAYKPVIASPSPTRTHRAKGGTSPSPSSFPIVPVAVAAGAAILVILLLLRLSRHRASPPPPPL
jgi:hypothetical protein